MYRQRRRSPRRRRCATAVTVFAAVLTYATLVPALSSASPVDDLLNQVGLGGAGGGAAPAEPKAGVPPTYTPPLHGTGPHGQGSVATLDFEPSNTNPYPSEPTEEGCSDPPADCEEVVIGDSRGEQGSSGYNGKVTLLYLLGNPIVQVTSNPGESNDGPLQDLQDGADQLCSESGGNICLTLLGMHSSSTSNSSTNSFTAAGLQLGGEGGIQAEAASSHGNISNDGTCQTSHGDSSVASVGAGRQSLLDLMQSSSTSTACNNGSQTVDNDSTVLAAGGEEFGANGSEDPDPSEGCADGTPNTSFTDLLPLLGLVCNADDTNGSQTAVPYGVREALTLFLLVQEDTPFLKITAAGSESHAVPPPLVSTATPPTGGAGGAQGGGDQGADEGGADGGGGDGAVAEEAAAGGDELAFTGSDLLILGLIGGSLILGGVALMSAAASRERESA
jgi:hypothetical protein